MHRFFLRETTRDLHHDLDVLISRLDLADDGDYAAFLRIHAAALLPLEAALEASGIEGSFPAWPRHRRSHALIADLRACDIEEGTGAALPAICGTGQRMGVLYVLEGSRLGGRLLERRARAQGARNAFLTHGAGQPLWQDFLRHLESLPDDSATRRNLANGASMAFEQYMTATAEILAVMQRGGIEPVGPVENANRIVAENRS